MSTTDSAYEALHVNDLSKNKNVLLQTPLPFNLQISTIILALIWAIIWAFVGLAIWQFFVNYECPHIGRQNFTWAFDTERRAFVSPILFRVYNHLPKLVFQPVGRSNVSITYSVCSGPEAFHCLLDQVATGAMPEISWGNLLSFHSTCVVKPVQTYLQIQLVEPSPTVLMYCGSNSGNYSFTALCGNIHTKSNFTGPYPPPRLSGFLDFHDMVDLPSSYSLPSRAHQKLPHLPNTFSTTEQAFVWNTWSLENNPFKRLHLNYSGWLGPGSPGLSFCGQTWNFIGVNLSYTICWNSTEAVVSTQSTGEIKKNQCLPQILRMKLYTSMT
eukprot:TRINITY_DN7081_c0_g1_i1.p1 TRINITY_DN7081_c0_g1~~TRINITY_DN7081_c0_g1_i1.p1  ORF type:complete len:327 (+),score=35.40 TRINITY_DN7081_c0_g1_i1:70-1050(+)